MLLMAEAGVPPRQNIHAILSLMKEKAKRTTTIMAPKKSCIFSHIPPVFVWVKLVAQRGALYPEFPNMHAGDALTTRDHDALA